MRRSLRSMWIAFALVFLTQAPLLLAGVVLVRKTSIGLACLIIGGACGLVLSLRDQMPKER